MTSRPVLGDFLAATHHQLEAAGREHTGATRRHAGELAASLHRLIAAIGSYTPEIATAITTAQELSQAPTAWAHASAEAQFAQASALAALDQHQPAAQPPESTSRSGLSRRLDTAATYLAAGHDLLRTHLEPSPGGFVTPRSAWAPVITSAPVGRALLAELTSIADQAAALCATGAPPPDRAATDTDHRLMLACRWLQVADATIRSAQHHDPVPATARELLRAIPATALPARRLPDGREPVPDMCDAVITTADRVGHLAWTAARLGPCSPGISVTSWRKIARASTATSHHCYLLLTTLAARAAQRGDHHASQALTHSAEQAAAARQSWLQSAAALDTITTDIRWHTSRAATEARDLALWTGRLTYGHPAWTLAIGPRCKPRPPETLAPTPGDLRQILTAVHHTTDALTSLATANSDQTRAATRAHRLLAAPAYVIEAEDQDRFVPATAAHRTAVLNACRQTAGITADAAHAVADLAVTLNAPSRPLAMARNLQARPVEIVAAQGRAPTHAPEGEVRHSNRPASRPVERMSPDLAARCSGHELQAEP